ncbi:MAG TPA: HAD family acid phosphatase [Galbitalea sp.]|jgi:predicted secreted acid phosphatase|nr:HAD family acid phosphatase [Galbitalea sp.]
MTPRNDSIPAARPTGRGARKALVLAAAMALVTGTTLASAAPALANSVGHTHRSDHDSALTPHTHFTMKPDGSSGLTAGGENIPNIDVVKKTVATYYGDPGTGIANTTASPYISQMDHIVSAMRAELPHDYAMAKRSGKTPAIVLDTDDTMLETYDYEVGQMHFNFNPGLNDADILAEGFPATPAMVGFENYARSLGFVVIGITGRSSTEQAASIQNLANVGYTGFTTSNYYVKWAAGAQPSYVTCATTTCSTVEYKAETRRHLEKDLGYDVALNVGDQWSDLQGGFADHIQKLPNPTYYLPSPDLPGVSEPQLAARTQFTMKADGSSGLTQGGEGIPNVDSVKATIAAYYGDTGTGTSNKSSSPYISEMQRIIRTAAPRVAAACSTQSKRHRRPAIVLDADDTTLWTYDMEVGAMHFVYDPTLQNYWVQNQLFPAVPSMTSLAAIAQKAGCAVIGLTGRNDDQKAATIANLAKVGYPEFTAANYYTKWTGVGASQQPAYITCAVANACTTIEYKSQTRAHIESAAGGDYDIVANFGDQCSDLIGGHADLDVKLPNPTYYLP